MGKAIIWGIVILIIVGSILRYLTAKKIMSVPGFSDLLQKEYDKNNRSLAQRIQAGEFSGAIPVSNTQNTNNSYNTSTFKTFEFGANGWLK